jgi:hypothetical protein
VNRSNKNKLNEEKWKSPPKPPPPPHPDERFSVVSAEKPTRSDDAKWIYNKNGPKRARRFMRMARHTMRLDAPSHALDDGNKLSARRFAYVAFVSRCLMGRVMGLAVAIY